MLAAGIEDEDLVLGTAPSLDVSRKLPPNNKPVEGTIAVYEKMISACLGSLITSLVVTPFDVIRIRMQQQELLPPPCCQNVPLVGGRSRGNGGNTLLKTATTTMTTTTTNPQPRLFWVDKNYCLSATNCSRITSTTQGFAVISRNEGLPTLWRGLSLTLFMAIPSNIIYFTGYEYIRDHSPISNHPLNPLFCGAAARTLSATFVAPVELMKTRLQSIPSDRSSTKMLSKLLNDLWVVYRQKGLKTLFTGLEITLWRDVPFSGIYWLTYEVMKEKIGNALHVDLSNLHQTDELRVFVTSFLAGSISGTIAAFFTNPFDVGKTRLQIARESDVTIKRPSMFKFLIDIYRREGYQALYSGFAPRVMKIAPSCAIMISSYEIGKNFFKKGNRD
jgi:solute carrier family 25 protein 39/40